DRALQIIYTLSPVITEHAIIRDEQSAEFVEACNTLQAVSSLGVAHQAILRGLEEPLEGLENALDLPSLARQFSESDACQCAEFLTCTQRILECREAAERVTRAGWDRVCERLIALPEPT